MIKFEIDIWFKVWNKVWNIELLCVYLYSSTVKASSDCKMSGTYLRGTDECSCIVNIYLDTFAKFLHLRIQKCHTSPPKVNLQPTKQLEREQYDITRAREKMIYVKYRLYVGHFP